MRASSERTSDVNEVNDVQDVAGNAIYCLSVRASSARTLDVNELNDVQDVAGNCYLLSSRYTTLMWIKNIILINDHRLCFGSACCCLPMSTTRLLGSVDVCLPIKTAHPELGRVGVKGAIQKHDDRHHRGMRMACWRWRKQPACWLVQMLSWQGSHSTILRDCRRHFVSWSSQNAGGVWGNPCHM